MTNLSGFDLRAPLMLVLDPARYFAGTPVGMGIGSGGLWLLDIGAALPNGVLAPGASTTVRTVTLNNPRGQHIELGSGVYALPYPATGALSWLPTAASPAQSSVVLRAYDTRGGFATRAFAIDVAGGNRAPSLDLPPTVRLVEGQPFALPMIAADPEGTLLSYAVDLLPPGARFDPVRQLLEWTPASDQAGTYRGVRFTVTDSTNTTVRIVDFIVDPVNAAPVLRGIPDRIVRQGDPVRFTVVADDADGDPVTYALASPLRGGSIDPTTGVFSWTPPYDLAGSFDLVFRATDGRTTGERKVRLTVVNANVAPVFDPVENLSVLEGEALTLRLFAFDADNPHFIRQIRLDDGALAPLEGTPPTVTYGSGALPAGATFDSVTGLLRWTPGYGQSGSYAFTFTATDDGDGSGVPLAGTVTVPVVVRNANRPPALADIPAQTVQKGQVLELPIAASDADGNPITLSFDGLPRFATFVPNVGDSGSGVLRFAPGERDRGDYVIRVTARDDGDGARGVLATTRTFVLSAQSASEPPLFAPIGDKVALIANELQFTLQASDLDQDALRFVADALPPGATLTSGISYGTEVFRWTPGAGDAGARDIAFSVTDSAGQHDTQTIRIVVRATNAPPILLPVGDRTVAEGQALVVQFAALDADGDMLSYSARGSAAGRELRRGDRHAALADQPVLAAGSYYRLDDGAAYNPAAIDGEPAQYTLVDGAGTRYAISVALDSLTGLSLMRLSQVFLRSDLGLVAP